MGGFAREDLDHVAVFELVVERDDAPVDLGADHGVADGGVDGVGEVDGRRAGGEVRHVAARGEDEHLVGEHIDLEGVDKFLGVRILLIFEETAHPLIILLVGAAGDALLILPMGGDAVFGDVVHLLRADLHLEHHAVGAHDRGVERLIAVGLGRADIILEAAEHGAVEVVDDAENVVAVRDGIDDDAEGEEVEHLVHGLALGIHLAVDAVGVLHAAVDAAEGNMVLGELALDLLLDALHERAVFLGLLLEGVGDLVEGGGVEVFEGKVLQLPLHALHTEPVGDGGVDLHRLERLLTLLVGGLILHRAHIVRAVGDLDEDDADVLGHGHEHLAQIFHLLLFLARVMDARELGDALDQIGDGGGEALGDVVVGRVGVLDAVVQEGGDDGFAVEMQLLGYDLRNGDGVGDEGRAVLALLGTVVRGGVAEGGVDLGEVCAGVVGADGLDQMIVLLLHHLGDGLGGLLNGSLLDRFYVAHALLPPFVPSSPSRRAQR